MPCVGYACPMTSSVSGLGVHVSSSERAHVSLEPPLKVCLAGREISLANLLVRVENGPRQLVRPWNLTPHSTPDLTETPAVILRIRIHSRALGPTAMGPRCSPK